MDNKVKNNQIYDLTKVKKSQITNYKNIIKFNKIEDLKTETFRSIIKDIDEEKKRLKEQKDKEPETEERQPEAERSSEFHKTRQKDEEPEFEEDQGLISDFEKMGVEDDGLDELFTPEETENVHYAKPEYSPGRTSFKQPFGYSHNARRGAKLVHRDHEAYYTFLLMSELIKYLDEIKFYEARINKLEKMSGISNVEELYDKNKELKEMIKELEAELERSEDENKRLREAQADGNKASK